jgi:ATP-dependent RNA helicase RhlE
MLHGMTTTFADLGLSEKILAAVEDMGYTEPTPVQEQAIPAVLEGRDVCAAAQTGTGKTAAFTLPIMDRLGKAQRGQGPLVLIVTPTRELAQQIEDVVVAVSKHTGHRGLTVVGGVGYEPQIKALKSGVDILVATPGRLIDLHDRKAVKLNSVHTLVIDEADRMLDMGFWPSMRKIISFLPMKKGKPVQTLLFSATLDDNVVRSVSSILHDPVRIEIAPKNVAADTVEQYIMPVDAMQKLALLVAVLKERGADRVLVFTRTKGRADAVAKRLRKEGYKASAIHAGHTQAQRSKALDNFRDGRTQVLVATDVLARGIDIPDIDHVINYDVPDNPEDYVHRIGRTGRAGETGYSLTFVAQDEITPLREIEYLMHKVIDEYDLPGFDYNDARIVPSPTRSPERKKAMAFRGSRSRNRGPRPGRRHR